MARRTGSLMLLMVGCALAHQAGAQAPDAASDYSAPQDGMAEAPTEQASATEDTSVPAVTTTSGPTVQPAPQPAAAPVSHPAVDSDAPEPSYMGGFGIGLKFGYLSFADGSVVTGNDERGDVFPARSGATLALSMTFGVAAGFTLEPYLGLGGLDSAGLHFGPHFNIKFGRVYVGSGFGIRAGYISNDYWFGGEFHARVPVRVTVYPLEDLGIIAEFGVGYGATVLGYEAGGSGVVATGLQFDFTTGIRWP